MTLLSFIPSLAMIKIEAALLLIGIVLMIAAVFSLGRARKKTNAAVAQTPAGMKNRDHLARARQTQQVRNDMDSLMVELEEMSKRMGAQLDAKTMYMEKVIREADERILQLQALQSTAPPGSAPAPAPDTRQGDTSPTSDAGSVDPVTHEVYALADQGKGARDIAAALSEPVGKVELILALRAVG